MIIPNVWRGIIIDDGSNVCRVNTHYGLLNNYVCD